MDYLSTFGLQDLYFENESEAHVVPLNKSMLCLGELGLHVDYWCQAKGDKKKKKKKRISSMQPQILVYIMENNLKSHVAVLMGLGIPNFRMG